MRSPDAPGGGDPDEGKIRESQIRFKVARNRGDKDCIAEASFMEIITQIHLHCYKALHLLLCYTASALFWIGFM